MEELQGGRDGQVYRSGDKVYRPSRFWSQSIHKLFAHLKSEQFDSAPESFGFDRNSNEILFYVSGDVYNYLLVGAISTQKKNQKEILYRDIKK